MQKRALHMLPKGVHKKKGHKEDAACKEIEDVIQQLAASFAEDSAIAYRPVVDAIAKKYPPDKNCDLDIFSSLVSFDIIERLHIQLVLRYCPEARANSNIREFVKNYNFMDTVLKKLFVKVYGSPAYSADRSRWILRGYFKYLKSRKTELPDMSMDEACYWKPDFGMALDWMRLCDGMIQLVHGEVLGFTVEYTGLMTTGRTAHRL